MATAITKTLSEVHPKLRTNGIGIGNTHRRISLGFLRPNKKNPLVKKYLRKGRRRGDEQRSFRSLGDDFGSSVRVDAEDPTAYLDEINEYVGIDDDDIDGGELSRTVSLPSRVSETPDLQPDVDWILQEHGRRYSSVNNSDDEEEEYPEEQNFEQRSGSAEEALEYEDFMQRVRRQLVSDMSRKRAKRPSFISVSSRGSVPTIYQEIGTEEDFAHETVTLKSEAKVLASYSIPLIFTFLLEQLFPVVCSLKMCIRDRVLPAQVRILSVTPSPF